MSKRALVLIMGTVLPPQAYIGARVSQPALPYSIAILDDDLDLLSLMEHWLTEAGYVVEACSSSRALARVLRRRRFDLLVLDFHLPETTGIELLKTIRLEWGINIPCVLVSADADKKTKTKSMKKGASAFLTKPFDKALLLNTIASYF